MFSTKYIISNSATTSKIITKTLKFFGWEELDEVDNLRKMFFAE